MDRNTAENKESTSYFCPHCGAANTTAHGLCVVCKQPLTPASQPSNLTSSSKLIDDRYQIIAELGSGGYSSVYKAYDTLDQRTVALKQILLRNLSAQQIIEATDTFNRECQLLSHLRHPQLPQLFDYFNDNEHWYLVIEFMEGETLEQAMQSTPDGLSLVTVTEMGLQLCEVLDYLHHHQPPVIFRDLKPGNVMRTPQRHLSLVDFGIARYFKSGQAKDTLPLGSPGFASPEQYGRAQTTPRSDIYSLGALLHFLLTGKDPSENPFHFEPLRGYGAGLTAMNTLIQSMVALDPEQRPADMQDIKEALQEIKQLLSLPKIQNIHKATPPSNRYGTPLWTPGGQSLQQQQVRAPASTNRYGGPLWGSGGQRQPVKPPSSSTNRYGGPLWTSSEQSQQQQQLMVPTSPHYTPPPTKIWRSRNPSPSSNRYGGPIWPSQQPTPKQPNRARRRLMIAGAGVGIALFAGWMYYKSQLPNMPPASLPTQISTEDITQTVVNETYDSDYVPSPDFRYGARVSNDNILHVDPFIEDTPTKSFPIEMSASNLYWSPDSTRIATVDAEICRIWDVQSGQSIAICDTDGVINSVAWSHDGQRIAISTSQGLYVCNTQSGFTIVSDENDFDSYGLTWSPDDAYLAFAEDGLIIWNVASQKQVRQFSIPPQPSDIISQIWSPSGKWLAFATRNQAWRVQPDISGSVNLLATPANTEICAIAWSPDGTQLALVLSQSDTCSTIEIWDVAQKSRVKTLNVPDAGTPLALGWQADGKTLYVLIDFNTIDTVKIEGS